MQRTGPIFGLFALVLLACVAAVVMQVHSASAACTNGATFVTDVTTPDGQTFAPGDTFTKIWRVRNSGTCNWTTRYSAAYQNGTRLAATNSVPLANVVPVGSTYDVAVNMTAPTTPGVYQATWRLRSSGNTPFGTRLTVRIEVVDPEAGGVLPQELAFGGFGGANSCAMMAPRRTNLRSNGMTRQVTPNCCVFTVSRKAALSPSVSMILPGNLYATEIVIGVPLKFTDDQGKFWKTVGQQVSQWWRRSITGPWQLEVESEPIPN